MDRPVATCILGALTQLAETGQGDVTRLQDVAGEWRLRVGDWRVRFRYDRPARTLEVLRILPRGQAYRYGQVETASDMIFLWSPVRPLYD